MKKNRYKLLFLQIFIILLLLLILPSCVTFKVKDIKKPENVDKKIHEEFIKYADEGKLFSAVKSYIEYISCCGNSPDTPGMEEKLHKLYIKKMSEEKETLKKIEYSFTLYSLGQVVGIGKDSEGKGINRGVDKSSEEGETDLKSDKKPSGRETTDLLTPDIYYENLKKYIKYFIDNDLDKNNSKKNPLENISYTLYLTRFLPDYYYPYEKLVENFLDRNNPVMAGKFLAELEDLFSYKRDVAGFPEGYRGKLDEYKKRIEEETVKLKKENILSQAISNTIESSVKIIVDKGIKTEGGRGVPDQELGTGVVINPKGYIITNYHIIKSSVDPEYEGYSKIYVIPGRDESKRYVADVVGYDRIYDLALLKVSVNLTSKIRFGDSDSLKEGEQVLAIGNPVGLTNTVTSGIVSAVKRPFIQIGNIIQIDTALNPGNSGGALINEYGYLVGIAFAGFLSLENLNFAIPSNLLLNDLFKLYKKGEVKRSWIGCSVEKSENGLLVNYISPNSYADLGGIKIGDIIKEINGVKVEEIYDIQRQVSIFEDPVVIKMVVYRDGKNVSLAVPLQKRPYLPGLYIYNHDSMESVVTPLFGIVLTFSDKGRKKFLPVRRVIPGSPAAEFGIVEGDELKLREIGYRKEQGIFYLRAELKSKRFGYINRSIVLYTYEDVNSFI